LDAQGRSEREETGGEGRRRRVGEVMLSLPGGLGFEIWTMSVCGEVGYGDPGDDLKEQKLLC
jgi:hypothetical protein